MKRFVGLAFVAFGCVFALASTTSCSPSLSQPFQGLKNQPVRVLQLQNYEPPQPQAGAAGLPQLPPQIQQWLSAGASLLPPGLLPPGLLPGAAPAPSAQNAPRFYNFRIINATDVADNKLRTEIIELFGKESNFQVPKAQSCMFAEFGFQIGQAPPPGTPPGVPSSSPPADILVSLSCDQVQMFNYGWPYGAKTAMGADTSKKVIAIVQRAFGR